MDVNSAQVGQRCGEYNRRQAAIFLCNLTVTSSALQRRPNATALTEALFKIMQAQRALARLSPMSTSGDLGLRFTRCVKARLGRIRHWGLGALKSSHWVWQGSQPTVRDYF